MEEKKIQDPDEINLIDYLIVLLKRKKMMAKVTFGVAVLAAVILILQPDIYKSDARILPPQSSSLSSQIASQFLGAGSSLSGIMGGTTPDLYVGMLQSTTVLDAIIKRFDLMKRYNKNYMVKTREILQDSIETVAEPSGLIRISVSGKDPKLAADMANAFVDELKKLTSGMAISDAAQRRLFYEDQLKATKLTLMKAEETLKVFQEKTGVLQVENQAKAVIEGIAALRAQAAAKEVEIKVMKSFSTSNNPDLQKAEGALRALRTEVKKMEEQGGSGNDPLMPTGRMPAVGLEYMRTMRDIKFNETLYELLSKQYELAKLDEAKQVSSIQVVDKAIPMDKRDSPKRAKLLILITFAGFVMSVFAAFFVEARQKLAEDPENGERLEKLRQYGDFGFKKVKKFILRKKKSDD